MFVQLPEFGSGGGFRETEVAESLEFPRYRFLLQGLTKLIDEIGGEARLLTWIQVHDKWVLRDWALG